MWEGRNNQEVGLEAAILQRKRNSSLVKLACTENVTGLKSSTEAAGVRKSSVVNGVTIYHRITLERGSGAFRKPVKGDREIAWRYRK